MKDPMADKVKQVVVTASSRNRYICLLMKVGDMLF
jgi:hypothetical protein